MFELMVRMTYDSSLEEEGTSKQDAVPVEESKVYLIPNKLNNAKFFEAVGPTLLQKQEKALSGSFGPTASDPAAISACGYGYTGSR